MTSVPFIRHDPYYTPIPIKAGERVATMEQNNDT